MSRVNVKACVTVYQKDDEEWGRGPDTYIAVTSYWNDNEGRFAVLSIEGHDYAVAVQDLRAALTAVTTR